MHAVTHRHHGPQEFDVREPLRFKPYLLVLVELERCLRLTSAVPSREPLKFYHLLLLGVRVQPGLGHKHYLAIRAGQDDEPAPLEDDRHADAAGPGGARVQEPPAEPDGDGVFLAEPHVEQELVFLLVGT